jgi:hypothetical protein
MRRAAFRVGMLTRGKILIALDSEQNLAFNKKYTAVRRYLTIKESCAAEAQNSAEA